MWYFVACVNMVVLPLQDSALFHEIYINLLNFWRLHVVVDAVEHKINSQKIVVHWLVNTKYCLTLQSATRERERQFLNNLSRDNILTTTF